MIVTDVATCKKMVESFFGLDFSIFTEIHNDIKDFKDFVIPHKYDAMNKIRDYDGPTVVSDFAVAVDLAEAEHRGNVVGPDPVQEASTEAKAERRGNVVGPDPIEEDTDECYGISCDVCDTDCSEESWHDAETGQDYCADCRDGRGVQQCCGNTSIREQAIDGGVGR